MLHQTEPEPELARRVRELEAENRALASRVAEHVGRAESLEAEANRFRENSAALESANERLTRVNHLLIERTAEAEAANRTKRDFLAVMSHELRTPLNAIGGYAEILEMGLNGPVTEAQRASLGRIRRNQEYLLSLITDVLAFAKEESKTIEVRMVDIPVAELLRSVQERIEPQVMAKKLRYRSDLPEAAVRVRGDRKRIEQILLNLLGNAVKFTEAGGAVSIACETDAERVRIRVEDSGCGIPREEQVRIFEPYRQAHGEASRREGGAGLGLAISQQLARRIGGDLTVESTPGEGSVFTLELMRGYRAAERGFFPPELTIFSKEEPAVEVTGRVTRPPEPLRDPALAS